MKKMNQTKTVTFEAVPEKTVEILDDMEAKLSAFGVSEKVCRKTRFRLEDPLVELIRKSPDGSRVKLTVTSFFNSVSVRLSCKGSEIDYQDSLEELFSGDIDEEAEAIIRAHLLKEYRRDIKLSRKGGINVISTNVIRRKKSRILISAVSMLLGVACGFVVKLLLSEETAQFLSDSVFGTGMSLFLRAIKMVISFLVFFSIASSLSGYKDLKELGKEFARVISLFALTSVVTILVTYGICNLIPIGDASLRSAADSSMQYDTLNGVSSLSDFLTDIVPDNYLDPFINTNMLQLLFIAILTGLSVAMMGKNGRKISDALSAADELFQKITLIIVKLMPVCIFCSMASLVIKTDLTELKHVAGWMGEVYLCDSVVILLLLMMVLILGKTSPFWFFKRLGRVLVSSFAMASSNAVMPMTMQTCREDLDISPGVYSFSIPLGIVINMDGGCVTMLVSTFFLARIYGVSITGEFLLPFFLSVFLLSVAAPAVPGGILLCLTVLLPQVGIPLEGISIIIGLYFMVSMIQTMTNVTSTVACSYVADRMGKK